MIQLETPNGLPVQVPETDKEDPSEKFTVDQISEAKDYYEKFGYVVFRNVIEPQDCGRNDFLGRRSQALL